MLLIFVILATQQLDAMVRTRQTIRKSIGNIQGEVYSFTRPDLSSSSVSNFLRVIQFVIMYKLNV